MNATKPWWKSKTIWTNVSLIIAGAIPVVSGGFNGVLSTENALAVSAILGAVNAVLQIVIRVLWTDTPIST